MGGGGRGPERPGGGAGACELRDTFLWGSLGVCSSPPGVGGRGGGPGLPGGRGGAPLAVEREEDIAGLLLRDGGGGGPSRGMEGLLAKGTGGGRSSEDLPGAGGRGGRPLLGMGGGPESDDWRPNAPPVGAGGRPDGRPGRLGGEGAREDPMDRPPPGPLFWKPPWLGRGVFGTGGGPPPTSGLGGVARGLGRSGALPRGTGGAPGSRGGAPMPPPKALGPEDLAPGGSRGGLTPPESEA